MPKAEKVEKSIKLDTPTEPLPGRTVGPATGNQNEGMVNRRNQIADEADALRAQELSELDEQPDDTPDDVQLVAEPDTPKDESKTYELVINGKPVKMTEEEVLIRAQKVGSADEYLRLASEAGKNWSKAALPNEDEPAPVEEDYRALAKALQIGTEEEAEQAIRDLVTKVTAKPSQTPDVSQVVRNELSLREEQAKFEGEFKDVLGDKYLRKLVFDRDAELAQADKETPYTERWRKAASEVRDWAKGFKELPTDKATRKAQVAPVPTAAGKQPATPEDEGMTDQDYIQFLAQKRGLGRAVQH